MRRHGSAVSDSQTLATGACPGWLRKSFSFPGPQRLRPCVMLEALVCQGFALLIAQEDDSPLFRTLDRRMTARSTLGTEDDPPSTRPRRKRLTVWSTFWPFQDRG